MNHGDPPVCEVCVEALTFEQVLVAMTAGLESAGCRLPAHLSEVLGNQGLFDQWALAQGPKRFRA